MKAVKNINFLHVHIAALHLFITVFAKIQFFQISVIYTFLLVCFFFFFFSRQLVEAIARPIYTKFGTNVSSRVGFRMHFKNLEKVKKPGHDEQKT